MAASASGAAADKAPPAGCQILVAIALAALIPALVLSGNSGPGFALIFLFAFPVVLFFGIVVGLPLYIFARRFGRPRWWMAMAAGALAASLSTVALPVASQPDANWWIGDVPIFIDGEFTAIGYAYAALSWFSFNALGALAGLAFWVLAIARWQMGRQALVLLLIAVLAVSGGIGMRELSEDRSCHNPNRHGGNGYQSTAVFGLDIPRSEWEAAEEEIARMGEGWGWSVHPDGVRGRDWLSLSMCREPGLRITAHGSFAWTHLTVDVYQPGNGKDWQVPMRAVHDRLKARWPGAVRYLDKYGEPGAAPPAWLTATAPPPPAAPK